MAERGAVADGATVPLLSAGALVPVLVALVAVGGGAWLAGVDAEHAGAIGLAAAAVLLGVRSIARTPDPFWPDPPQVETGRGWHGAALQSRLLEQLDAEPDRIPRLLLPRLRSLVTAVLTERGVAAGSVQARELVGPQLHDLLVASTWTASGRPGATELTDRVLTRVDELRAAASPVPPSTTASTTDPPGAGR